MLGVRDAYPVTHAHAKETSGARQRKEKRGSPYSNDSVHLFQRVLKQGCCIVRAGGALNVETVPLGTLEVAVLLACHEFMNTVLPPPKATRLGQTITPDKILLHKSTAETYLSRKLSHVGNACEVEEKRSPWPAEFLSGLSL